MLSISTTALGEIQRHAEGAFPEESCGLLSATAPGGAVVRTYRCTNIQNQLHALEPAEHPRTAANAYYVDPLEIVAAQKAIDESGHTLSGMYHSHPDEEPYFSAEDRRRALAGDEPMWPGAHYVVISVKQGRAACTKSFAWDPTKSDFTEEPLVIVED